MICSERIPSSSPSSYFDLGVRSNRCDSKISWFFHANVEYVIPCDSRLVPIIRKALSDTFNVSELGTLLIRCFISSCLAHLCEDEEGDRLVSHNKYSASAIVIVIISYCASENIIYQRR